MNTKYKFFTLFIVAVLAVVSVTASIVVGASAANHKTEITSSTTVCAYILRDYNGYLAIFKEGVSEPLRTLDVYTEVLPERDREALKKGIHANSLEEILALAEDYDG